MRDGTLIDISSQKEKKKDLIFRDTVLNPMESSKDDGSKCIQLLASLEQRKTGGYRDPGVAHTTHSQFWGPQTNSEDKTRGDKRGVLTL